MAKYWERRSGKPGLYGRWKDEHGKWTRAKSPYASTRDTDAWAIRQGEECAKIAEGRATRERPLLECVTLYGDWLIRHNRSNSASRSTRSISTFLASTSISTWHDLRPARVHAYQHRRLTEGRAPSTVNTELNSISALISWSIRSGHIHESPLGRARIDKLPSTPERKRALSADECNLLLSRSRPASRPYWELILHTGLRSAELCGLTWSRYDPTRCTLHIPAEGPVPGERSKNHIEAYIRLDSRAQAIIAARPVHDIDGYIFLGPRSHRKLNRNALTKCFARDATKAGFDLHGPRGHLCVHALRHTFGSLLLDAGAAPKSVQEAMRHKTFQQTMDEYGHFFEKSVQSAIEQNPLNTLAPHLRPA